MFLLIETNGHRTSFLGSLFSQHCSARCSHMQRIYSGQHGGHMTQGILCSQTEEQTGTSHSLIVIIASSHFYVPLLCEQQERQTIQKGTLLVQYHLEKKSVHFFFCLNVRHLCCWCI